MCNGTKFMFDFDLSEGGTGNRYFLIELENFYWELKKIYILISQGNRTINSLSEKDFIHLSGAGSAGWGFDRLTSSRGNGGLVPLHHLTT